MRLTITVPRIAQRADRWEPLRDSILPQLHEGDELLAELDEPPHKDYGCWLRNKYIMEAKGDYILFADDDDLYLPDALAVIRQRIAGHPGKSLAFNAYFEYDGKRIITGGQPIFGQGFRWFQEVYAQSQVIPIEQARVSRPWDGKSNNGLYSDQKFWDGGGAGSAPVHFSDIIIQCAIGRQGKARDW